MGKAKQNKRHPAVAVKLTVPLYRKITSLYCLLFYYMKSLKYRLTHCLPYGYEDCSSDQHWQSDEAHHDGNDDTDSASDRHVVRGVRSIAPPARSSPVSQTHDLVLPVPVVVVVSHMFDVPIISLDKNEDKY